MKSRSIVALLALVLACSQGCGAKTKRIVFLTNGDDPFWDACLQGLLEGEKKYDLAKAGRRACDNLMLERVR